MATVCFAVLAGLTDLAHSARTRTPDSDSDSIQPATVAILPFGHDSCVFSFQFSVFGLLLLSWHARQPACRPAGQSDMYICMYIYSHSLFILVNEFAQYNILFSIFVSCLLLPFYYYRPASALAAPAIHTRIHMYVHVYVSSLNRNAYGALRAPLLWSNAALVSQSRLLTHMQLLLLVLL